MRVVLQRVARAEVRVDGDVVGRIGHGYLLLAGFSAGDTEDTLEWMAAKIVGLRLFPAGTDASDDHVAASRVPPADSAIDAPRAVATSSFDSSLADVNGAILVVSQFTLYADARKGRRPSFSAAAPPEIANELYERFVAALRAHAPGAVETGRFGAMMDIELVNDGPVTLVLER
ncbi:MAG: D-aminoacyl-tRNA deacylase [Longimicrobiales bacterium]